MLSLIFTNEIWKRKRNGVISVSSRFYSSQRTWIRDPSFGLSLGPVAPISPKKLFFFFSFLLSNLSSIPWYNCSDASSLFLTVSLVFQLHFMLPCVCLPPCLCLNSSFLPQQCFMIGSWSLTAIELIENTEEYLKDLQLSGDAQIR